MGEFKGLDVGGELCGMFDIAQGRITYNDVTTVKCIQAKNQEAGKYNVSSHVISGRSFPVLDMKRSSFSNEYYEQTVLPSVSDVTPNSGFIGGQKIKISGTGFSKKIEKNIVSVDGVNCEVLSSSHTEI